MVIHNTLNERHTKNCTCSYCKGDAKLHYGLNIPRDWKAWNSWWIIKYWPRCYFRFTRAKLLF